jgi:DnaJ family protein C protein 7
MGDLENSIKHYQQVMRCDPDNRMVRDQYKRCREIEEKKEAGNAAFKRSSLDEAIASWSAAIELDKGNASVTAKLYCNKATALAKLKRHEEAIDDSTEAIRLDRDYAKAYVVSKTVVIFMLAYLPSCPNMPSIFTLYSIFLATRIINNA